MVHGISSKAAFRLVKMKIRALVQSNCLFSFKTWELQTKFFIRVCLAVRCFCGDA